MAYFVDRTGTLTNKRRTATGGYLVDAALARVGVMAYARTERGPGENPRSAPPKAWVNHLNTPEVLQANMGALQTVPVTNRHPTRMVDPETYKDVACGHIVGNPEFRDGKIFATLAIQDAELIEDIEAGRAREVSMGYMAHSEPECGTYDGQSYDMVRKKIEWNHVAVVPAGRAGKDVCLVLDSADIPGEIDMKIKILGKEYDADKVQAAVDALELLLEQAKADVKAANDAAETARSELATQTSDEAINARVQAKFDAAEKEKAEAAEKAEKARVIAEKRAKVIKAFPRMKNLDAKSDDVIETLFDSLAEEEASVDALAPGAQGGEPSADTEEPEAEETVDAAPQLSARDRMLANAAKLRTMAVETGE